MRWLVVGASGMLGRDLVPLLRARGHEVRGLGRAELDVTDVAATSLIASGIDVLVNCAAYTAVDAAEADEARAFAVNATGAGNLARAAGRAGARMVQVSTDYVFDGTATEPYAEGAPVGPVSAYGRSKVAGEWAVRAEAQDHLVVRTAWLYGAHGRCFPRTIARAAADRGRVDVVVDQVGQPTWTRDLADLVERLVVAQVPAGTYHGTSSGRASWFEFAGEVVAAAGLDPAVAVRPSSTDLAARPAPRPAWSVLGHEALSRVGVTPIGPWRERWVAAAAEVLGPREPQSAGPSSSPSR